MLSHLGKSALLAACPASRQLLASLPVACSSLRAYGTHGSQMGESTSGSGAGSGVSQRRETPDQPASFIPPEQDPNAIKAEMPEDVVRAAESNDATDTVRHLAGKLNQAVGGSYDFPQTGGTTVREMGREILGNVAGPAVDAGNRAVDRVSQAGGSAYESANRAMGRDTSNVWADTTNADMHTGKGMYTRKGETTSASDVAGGQDTAGGGGGVGGYVKPKASSMMGKLKEKVEQTLGVNVDKQVSDAASSEAVGSSAPPSGGHDDIASDAARHAKARHFARDMENASP